MTLIGGCYRSSIVFSLGALFWLPQVAFPQASQSPEGPAASSRTQTASRNTVDPVVNGSARLVSHYKSDQMLRVAIGLAHPHLAEEEQFVRDVQDKSSPLFRKFLTEQQWESRFAPTVKDEQAVVDWAQAQGLQVTHRLKSRLLVDVQAPVSTLERAFGVTVNSYQLGAITFFSNDRDPVVPASLSAVVQAVIGLNNLQRIRPAIKNFKGAHVGNPYNSGPARSEGVAGHADADRSKLPAALAKAAKPSLTNGFYDPPDIWASTAYNYRALYNQGHCCNPLNNPGNSPPESSIAIATFTSYDASDNPHTGFAQSDINGFQAQYPYLAFNWVYYQINGTNPCCDDETTLDLEWSAAMSNSLGATADTSLVYVYEGANDLFSTWVDVYGDINDDGKARVFTTSWGCAEDCWQKDDPNSFKTAQGIFTAMASKGWTMVAASGDQGATADCVTTSVSYPGSDPNIVAAGGTTLETGPGGFSSEIGWQGGTGAGSCSKNDGGSTGGCSTVFGAPFYQTYSGELPACGSGSRSVPDMALNANVGQNYFFNGTLSAVGGTSIVAPELAGFFAQENAYLLYLGSIVGADRCYSGESTACAPMGPANKFLYYFGTNPHYAPHYPFYDITSGCNSNDVTAESGLTYYCASAGYDLVTGWGSANMLQLSWAINTYIAGAFGAPSVTFGGPTTGVWYNTDQTVSWSIAATRGQSGDLPNGIAGYSSAWDTAITDSFSKATPGSGDSFYSGPQHPNATTGSTDVASIGQGCHTVYVYAWDNGGYPSGNQTYGQVCYDTTLPVTTDSLSGTYVSGEYDGPVQITLTATDTYSGVAQTLYQLDAGSTTVYSGPLTVSTVGPHTLVFWSVDHAGNVESYNTVTFVIRTAASAALQFIPVTPCRIADTRNANGPFGGPEIPANGTRSFTIPSSACGIPATATAFSLNATVVPVKTLQYLTIWPAGETQPNVSTLNSYDGRIKANALIVPGSATGAISVYATDATQFILDIDGYFVPANSSSALAFYDLTPCRVVDTRGSTGSLGGPSLVGGATRSFPVLSSVCSVPSSAVAYSFNYTVIPKKTLNYLTTWPTGGSQPLVSTLNAPTGTTTANAAIVPAGTSGSISVYVTDNTDLLIDVNGYFAAPGSNGLSLYTLPPCRVIDTRSSGGAFTGTRTVPVATSACNVSTAAQSYVFNATVVPPGPLDYLTLWANGQTQPVVSTLNAFDGAVTSNMALVPTSNGEVNAFGSNSTQLILDISGYFAP